MNARLQYFERWLNRPEVLALPQRFKRVRYFEDFCDAQAPLDDEAHVVGTLERPKWAVLSCPCGCGHVLNVNLMRTVRPSWNMTVHGDGTLTLLPSLWVRDAACRSHFFLFRSRIVWARPDDHEIPPEDSGAA